ncbi:MAG: VanW family protein, partial [Clostridia bacterium]
RQPQSPPQGAQGYSGYPQGTQAWYAPPPPPPQASGRRRASGGQNSPAGDGRPPRKKRSLKWQLIKVLIVLLLLGGAGVGGYILKTQSDVRPYLSVFLPNVSVDGIDLSGKTWEEGSAAVWAQANEKQNGWRVRLMNTSGEYKDITADMLGISFDPTMALEQAWGVGHAVDAAGRKSIFDFTNEIAQAKSSSSAFSSAQQSANTAPIDSILQTLENVARKEPQDAQILSFNPDDTDQPFVYQPEVYGQRLDTYAVKEHILEMVNTLQSGEVMLETQEIAPHVTVANLQQTVSLRYRAVTAISSASSESRTENIRVAFRKINGLVIEDGGKFSFNNIVGKRTEQNGFGPAIEYAYGLEVNGTGGGVCQASTTVYLAAIQAGMSITKRSAHSNPVSYTELGLDATVSDTRGREVDFAFKNNSGGPVYLTAHVIQSGNSKRNMLCEVRIYGPDLGNVHYELVSETVEVLPKPEESTLVEDKDGNYVIFQDETKLVSKGREGYVVETYLNTYVDGQMTAHDRVSRDTYPARSDRIYVGVLPRI